MLHALALCVIVQLMISISLVNSISLPIITLFFVDKVIYIPLHYPFIFCQQQGIICKYSRFVSKDGSLPLCFSLASQPAILAVIPLIQLSM